jgi:primosomal protein N' (replication factor Y)
VGVVIEVADASEIPAERLRQVVAIAADSPPLPSHWLALTRFAADYYQRALGEVVLAALPPRLRRPEPLARAPSAYAITDSGREALGSLPARSRTKRTLLAAIAAAPVAAAELPLQTDAARRSLRELLASGWVVPHRTAVAPVAPDERFALTPAQSSAVDAVLGARDRFEPFLVHGVTGSGKTEVYLQAIAHALERGDNALVLVPEISLTPQLVRRFRARFGGGIAVLHSALSDGERYDEWRRIRRGLVRIVIGARSALFAPLERIGIIVVDEEHESSFKQADGLRYNARDLSLVRGQMEKAVVVLGSATPLVTSLYAAEQGKLALLPLTERVENRPMPLVSVVQMQDIKEAISPQLAQALEETLTAGEQSLVFLNRRGFATFLVCSACGEPLTCPNCSVTLTFHRQRRQSVCHYCDYAVPAPGVCPACDSLEMKDLGAGTERVESDLREQLPAAGIVRMDSDTTSGKDSHNRLLKRMADRSADILIGTQMIAKGHDFPGVTLVGVVNGEASLNMPDFRSAERTFQLLSQVIGRAGRGELPGRVIVQALNTSHYAIQCAIGHDGESFYRQELDFRREAGYPPFTFLAALSLSGTSEKAVEERADMAARLLARLKKEFSLRIEILGPAPAPLYRLRGRFRRQILLKSITRNDLRQLVTAWYARRESSTAVREIMDIDPVDMM